MHTLHAYIDESRRSIDGGHIYLMVAVVVPADVGVPFARALRGVLPKGAHSLHFRHDRQALQRQHLELIAEWATTNGVWATGAHARIASARHGQRARVRCLSALASHLSDRAVDQLVIESRQEHDNRADDRSLLDCRRDGSIAADVVWTHRRYTEEELLWPADAVAGVYGLWLTHRDHHDLWEVLPHGFVSEAWSGTL